MPDVTRTAKQLFAVAKSGVDAVLAPDGTTPHEQLKELAVAVDALRLLLEALYRSRP